MQRHNVFLLDEILNEQKNHLIRFYQEKNPSINLVEDLGSNIVMELKKEFLAEDKASLYYPLEQYPSDYPIGYYPNIVEDISSSKFYILKPETYLPETETYLILIFCLGMLCRYYPDIWIKVIDENVQVAELTDSLLNIIYRKFPNLILDQMTETKHYVHS